MSARRRLALGGALTTGLGGFGSIVLVQLLRVATFLLGIVQLIWIARYVYEDFGGIIGVVVAWVVFPVTLIVSPIYGVLTHGDWLGVLLFAIGPVTYLLLGMLGTTRIGDPSADD